jgi:two-component system, OmpR family, sensor kinase
MDDIKGRVKHYLRTSLRWRLSLWLAVAICCVALLAGAFAFYSAFRQAHALQDDMLRQVAALASRQPLAPPASADADVHGDSDSKVYVQLLGTPVAGEPALPADLPDGLQTVRADGETYRVMVRGSGAQRLAVAQETSVRDEAARDSALLTLIPFLLLVPVLLLVVTDLVRKVFAPVREAAQAVDARGEDDLRPLASAGLPDEIRPFTDAINRLLVRVGLSMDEQRRFIADAAHELRTPLTALSLQAERLAATPLPQEAQARLATLRAGMARSRSLLEQLLSLARAQQAGAAPPASALSVHAICRQVLEDLLPLAEARQIDIGMLAGADALVHASAIDLATVVRNLAGNAIRYTPPGGRVDLSLRREGHLAILAIEDNGPGIDAAERERVFDPFYRVLGSGEDGAGLGLSIVRAICLRLGASVSLGCADPASGTGLRVEVRLPAAN